MGQPPIKWTTDDEAALLTEWAAQGKRAVIEHWLRVAKSIGRDWAGMDSERLIEHAEGLLAEMAQEAAC